MKGRIDQHARYRELIAARLDRPLTRIELRTLTSHLKKCAACQGLDAEYRAQRNLVRSLPAPIPPRDLWARTSASLDHEVARAYRANKWRRRMSRGRRSAQPSTGLVAAIGAIGVATALAVLQLAPAIGPAGSISVRPTPLDVAPQQIAWLGLSKSDVAVYSTEVSQVCPASGPLDCIPPGNLVRTPVQLPANMRAGNIALNSTGTQLALVGHYSNEDVIAVVAMPSTDSSNNDGKNGDHPNSVGGPQAASTPANNSGSGPLKSHPPDNSVSSPAPVGTDAPAVEPAQSIDPGDQPSVPPQSAVPGLAVLAILENVQSAGAAPDWSPNGGMLAFSAMPDDQSQGPDVYIWSPGDAQARAITTDHASFFASWSGNHIVVSRLTGSRVRNYVIDPKTLEERPVGGPQLWLPVVNTWRTQALGWYGQLDTSGLLPMPGSGALYLMDWALVDPFGAATPAPTSAPDVNDAPEATDAPATEPPQPDNSTPAPSAAADESPAPDTTGSESATPAPLIDAPPTDTPTTSAPSVPDSLTPLEPDRDPRAAPVVDWQAHWSADGEVLGVWIADSAGSTWGRLAVLAVDQTTQRVSQDNPPLAMTMARRGFSLGANRVAWVGPSDTNVDGELRIRTWGTDGVGGLRLVAPNQEEVVPAS